MRAALAALLIVPTVAWADPPPVARPISYFLAHPSETVAVLAVCHDNAQFANTPTCVNAEAAATGLHGRTAPDLNALLSDQRYWSANPIARDGYLVQCQLGTAPVTRFCGVAARSALQGRKQ